MEGITQLAARDAALLPSAMAAYSGWVRSVPENGSVMAASTWTDVGIFWATVGAAVATTAAVIVALFGPRWQERRRRPDLSLTTDPPGMSIPVESGVAEPLRLRLTNRAGRDPARDVEVFVTASGQGTDAVYVAAEDETLNFDDPFSDAQGCSVSTVPAGHARLVNVAVIEAVADGGTNEHAQWGYLATVPRQRMRHAALMDAIAYDVTITITGSNFDAVIYRGRLEFRDDSELFNGTEFPIKTLAWAREPVRSSE
jgi:hypothetical protein